MKKSEALGQINAMSGIVKLIDIINIIDKIDNLKTDTLNNLNPVDDYVDGTPMKNIYIDLSYQRKLKIQEIINRLLKNDGYDKTAAGHLDLAERTDGRLFCWDGFHRGIMAGIVNCTNIPCAKFTHKQGWSQKRQCQLEAEKFVMRNGQTSKVSAGALFKAEVTAADPTALATLEVMKTCKLNIEGVNEDVDAYDLGGFAFFLKHYANYDVRNLSDASKIIRTIWDDKKTISVTLLIGLAHFLTANDKPAFRVLSPFDIRTKIKEIVGTGQKKKNQQYFLKPMLKGKTAVSVCYNLVEKAFAVAGETPPLYNDDGADVKSFFDSIGLEEDEIDALDREL
jgi:hypothetical protein